MLQNELLDQIKDELAAIKPMPAVFDKAYVKKLDGEHVKTGGTKWDYAQMVMEDIQRFQEENSLDRLVMVWCGSTEIFLKPTNVHASIEAFEEGMKNDDASIAPSKETKTPICGKDFKTGQTLMKTILAPGLKARMLGLNGWFSTNILGNRDGEVLDDPDSFKTKEESKLGVLEYILQPDTYPQLYENMYHKVRINYYPPRGDNKEGWDNIDIFGWLGYPMQIKIDFLCRDSILAAPLVLDLAIFLDLAKRAGFSGIQEWLSFYFKSPQTAPDLYPENDLFIQLMKLKNTLRYMAGEEELTHLGADYYDYYK